MIESCVLCGHPAEATHHLIFGRGMRKLADEDKLTIPVCNDCHNFNAFRDCRIHENPTAEKLSKMLGQYMWMVNQVCDEEQKEALLDAFRERYGRRYL